VRSASALLIAGLALTGCATTQQQAARLQLNSARIRAAQDRLRLTGRAREVVVRSVSLIESRNRSAVVVVLRNTANAPVSDLPLLVGVSRSRYLNAAAGLPFFQSHVPAIAAHGSLRWVLTLGRPLPRGSEPFARVGAATGDIATQIKALPAVQVVRAGGQITVRNNSSIPQYQLPVYAIASRRGRYVAAGGTTIADLGGGAQVRLRVPLIGDPRGATVSLEAPPTIFN
jgi:hypothetical protein